jgi:Ni,Fe-hydrogenase III small subunit/ferredoxin
MPWITRGLREGIVTTRYPKKPDRYSRDWQGAVRVQVTTGSASDDETTPSFGQVASSCPTGAISTEDGSLTLDRGACILCGRCVDLRGDVFRFDSAFEVSTLGRKSLVVPQMPDDDRTLERTRQEVRTRLRSLKRSIHIRHVDAGSDGSDEWEVAALTNPVYDVQRLGIFFTATPRHADLLLVTGAGTAGMSAPLRVTYEAMPGPKIVIAAGVDAASGGVFAGGYAVNDGIGGQIPVDVWVPGSPASPFGLLHGILLGIGLLPGSPSSVTGGTP